jgi:hypothetical protein
MMSVAILGSLEQAGAIDLTGAWATSADECKNVFVRKGRANQITFAPMSELHGGGFIVEPSRLVGRSAKCAVKARKDDGQTVNILASCVSDIMLSSGGRRDSEEQDRRGQRRSPLQAGFGQIEAQVLKPGMVAEAACTSLPWTIIPMVITGVQDYIAAGEFRGGEQLVDPGLVQPGTPTPANTKRLLRRIPARFRVSCCTPSMRSDWSTRCCCASRRGCFQSRRWC